MWVVGRTLLSEGSNVELGCFSPKCPSRGPRGRGSGWAPRYRLWRRRCPLTNPLSSHSFSSPFSILCGAFNSVSRPVDRKPTPWLSTFARVPLRLPPSPRITSLFRRRGGRANAFPIQSPVRDGRLGLCGVGVSHCKAKPLTACTGIL
ncbi:hypothetical protein V8D89_008959, partial [Ganoderma adspersum]